METGCYPTSSYAWKSIIQTQPLISQGTRWIVRDGEHVRFWKDKWLPQSNLLIPINPGTFANPHLLVKDLFIPGTKLWDEQKLRNLIEERDVTTVLRIRPSTTSGKDKLIASILPLEHTRSNQDIIFSVNWTLTQVKMLMFSLYILQH